MKEHGGCQPRHLGCSPSQVAVVTTEDDGLHVESSEIQPTHFATIYSEVWKTLPVRMAKFASANSISRKIKVQATKSDFSSLEKDNTYSN